MFNGPISRQYLHFEKFNFDVYAHKLKMGEKEIVLTNIESSILYKLITNKNKVISLNNLAESIWGDNYPGANESIRVHIRNLREKVEPDPSKPIFIITRPGIGYVFVQPD